MKISFSGSRVVQCGRTDVTKLIVAFRNFAKGPKNPQIGHVLLQEQGKELVKG